MFDGSVPWSLGVGGGERSWRALGAPKRLWPGGLVVIDGVIVVAVGGRGASCGRLRACGSRRLPLRPQRGGWRACTQAAGSGWVGGGGGNYMAPLRADLVGSGGEGRRGAAVIAFCARPGQGPAMPEVVWVGVRGGGNSSRQLHLGAARAAPGFPGVFEGACAGHWAGWVYRGPWGSLQCLCAGCRVWGVVRGVRRVGPWRACAVDWAGGGGSCRGARGCTRWWACVGSRVGSGGGGAGARIALGGCYVGVCVRLQRRACVVCCRPGGLEEKLAVFCGRGKDFADECAYLVHLLVSGAKRVC